MERLSQTSETLNLAADCISLVHWLSEMKKISYRCSRSRARRSSKSHETVNQSKSGSLCVISVCAWEWCNLNRLIFSLRTECWQQEYFWQVWKSKQSLEERILLLHKKWMCCFGSFPKRDIAKRQPTGNEKYKSKKTVRTGIAGKNWCGWANFSPRTA